MAQPITTTSAGTLPARATEIPSTVRRALAEDLGRGDVTRYLLLTECATGDNIAAANPGKEMLRLCSVRCPHMYQITLEDTLEALRQMRYVVEVPEEIRARAARAVERMVAIG